MITLGSTTAASMLPDKYGGRGELPSPRLLFGTAITFTGLAMLADVKPAIGNPLSAAIAITALIYYTFPLIDNYVKVSSQSDGKAKNNPSNPVNLTPVGKAP